MVGYAQFVMGLYALCIGPCVDLWEVGWQRMGNMSVARG